MAWGFLHGFWEENASLGNKQTVARPCSEHYMVCTVRYVCLYVCHN